MHSGAQGRTWAPTHEPSCTSHARHLSNFLVGRDARLGSFLVSLCAGVIVEPHCCSRSHGWLPVHHAGARYCCCLCALTVHLGGLSSLLHEKHVLAVQGVFGQAPSVTCCLVVDYAASALCC